MTQFILGIIIAIILFPISIKLMYKFGQVTAHKRAKLGSGTGGVNSLWMKIQPKEQKNNIPNQGGVVIWIGSIIGIIINLMFFVYEYHYDFQDEDILNFIILITLYGLAGFLDVLITNLIKKNMTLREIQERFEVRIIRFIIAWIPAFVGIYLFHLTHNPDFSLLNIQDALIVFGLSIFIHFAVYSAELTDGLDGLMIGIYIIINLTLLIILKLTEPVNQFGLNIQPTPYAHWYHIIYIILGLSVVDLWFNKKPAKFFNGGAGTMPLGAGAVIIALQTHLVVPYLIVSSITWVIMFSSMIQILSMKLFKKRVFKIAPLHHHFQALGWSERKIVYIFWAYTFIAGVIAIIVSQFF